MQKKVGCLIQVWGTLFYLNTDKMSCMSGVSVNNDELCTRLAFVCMLVGMHGF